MFEDVCQEWMKRILFPILPLPDDITTSVFKKNNEKEYNVRIRFDCVKSEINNSFNLSPANRFPAFTQNRARLVARGTSETR